MRIEIVDRDGSMLRYLIFDDAGHELRQVHRDCSAEIGKAQRQKRALVDVLAEAEGGKSPKNHRKITEIPPMPDAPVAKDHTHEEFAYGVKEHDHDLIEHNHPHGHPEIAGLDERFTRHETEQYIAHKGFEERLLKHSHEDRAALKHEHADLAQAVENVRSYAQMVHDRPLQTHDHDSRYVKFESFEVLLTRLQELVEAVSALRSRIDGHEHTGYAASGHEHEGIKHEHTDLEEALEQHVVSTQRKAELRVLSREETQGKVRWIVEEL